MKNKPIEQRIKAAFTHAVPDVLDAVLSSCDKQKGKVLLMQEKKRGNPWVKRVVAMAAALVVMIAGVSAFSVYNKNYAVAATVSLDVNPSIEIEVNQKNSVLNINALNEDGKIVLGDMNFKGSDLDITINALIGSMLRNGYLSEIANSILISVDGDDPAKGAQLQEKLTQEINELLQTDTFSGAVLSQTIAPSSELQQLSAQYGITLGKAQLIQQLTQNNPVYTFEALVPLSINELNLLSESGTNALDKVDSIGAASDKAYIGAQEAQKIAFAHAAVSADQVSKSKTELEYEKGTMVYEIEFVAGGYEYEYDIDAISGEVVAYESDWDDEDGKQYTSASVNLIGEQKAKDAALAHASVSNGSTSNFVLELDRDDGMEIYEIEFNAGGYEYEYEINAATGEVIKCEKEREGAKKQQSASVNGAHETFIGKDRAKQIALEHAKLSEGDITDCNIDLDWNDGVRVYEVDFDAGGYEYGYDIDASTGEILNHEKEMDD